MSAVSPSAFGQLLRRLRRTAGLTQEELAERAGLSVEGIGALERGVNRSPRRDTITLIAEALGLTPEDRAALEAAARRGSDGAAAAPLVPVAGQLVGRVEELALVGAHLVSGTPPLLLFGGEPGIGKTRLLQAGAERAAAAGWTVLMGGCQRRSGQEPYAAVAQAIERHLTGVGASEGRHPAVRRSLLTGCGWLVRVLPELAETIPAPAPAWTLASEQERRLIFTAVARFLANVAGPAGTLLVLDDLQWAGADTLDMLDALVRSPVGSLRVIGAYRDTDVRSGELLAVEMADLAASALVRQHTLRPLAAEDAARLLEDLLPDAHTTPAQRVIERAGGVPFFLVSCAQALQTGTLDASDDAAVPWDVAQSIRQRAAALPEPSRRLLAVAAVAGREAPRAVILDALGEPTEIALEAIDAACDGRLLVEVGADSYGFAHDLIREVIAGELGSARRAAIHRRLAETLERRPRSAPEMLAYHYTRAGEPERAVVYLERAGDRAEWMRAHANAEAAYREQIAAQMALGRQAEAAGAGEKLGAALRAAGRYGDALVALEEALALARAAGDAERTGRVTAEIGRVHADRGTTTAGVARLAPVVASADAAAMSVEVRAALFDALAQLYHLGGRYDDQLEAAFRACELTREVADPQLRSQVALRRGNALRMLGRMDEARLALEEVIAGAAAAGDRQNLCYALENASVVYLFRGALGQSSDYVARALALADEVGDPLAIGLMTLRRGINRCIEGEWSRAREDFETASLTLRPIGASWAAVYVPLGLGQLGLMSGDAARATAHLEEAIRLAAGTGDMQALRWAQSALAERELLRGMAESARDRLLPLLDEPGQQESLVTYLLPYLAWAHMELGDDDAAGALLDECLRRARAEHLHLALVEALRVRALHDLRRGRHDEGREAVAEVLALSRAMPYPHAEAKALFTSGMIERAAGRSAAARAHLEAARDLLAWLGERMYRPLVDAALAALPAGD